MAATTDDLMKNNARQVLESTNRALASIDKLANETNSLIGDNRAAISEFSEQGLREVGPAIVELRETLRSLRQVADRLSDSNSLLLGREQPKEFEPR
jgi:phospholipid/cholesterol/gamma-HCH transport system substrate-binding protein